MYVCIYTYIHLYIYVYKEREVYTQNATLHIALKPYAQYINKFTLN